ncbi:MAG: hypothetical protein JW811_01185 [Clostridiales bacterium]|nr:hypothetical protein [Clostridiales bacterium]
MRQDDLVQYIRQFFAELELTAEGSGRETKEMLEQSLIMFLDDETKETAFDVYKLFFGYYRIVLEGDQNPFMDLLDVLSAYEERAATLIEKQRDHYIHSVNVFILGICVYSQNKKYQKLFSETVLDEEKFPENYRTRHEEFFFRWGLASLFHDVGYPVEIIAKQISRFLKFATDADHDDTKGDIKSHLEFENFRRLNSIAEIVPKGKFIEAFYKSHPSSVYVDLLQPIDLLAQKIHMSLGIPMDEIKDRLDHFTADMAKFGFIDHGFYSAMIVLKWYGYLIQVSNGNPMRFFDAIVDSAGAILLHNYYSNVIEKEFTHRPLSAAEYPVAFLLILCDELQEWNRVGYGMAEKYRTHAKSANIKITGDALHITYIAEKGFFNEKFIVRKNELLNRILNLREIMKNGLVIQCETTDEVFIEACSREDLPRPMLENLERLAREIHKDYIRKQNERDLKIEVPEDYTQLEASYRYNNLRQAMNMDCNLRKLGYAFAPEDYDAEAESSLPADIIEQYAKIEHADWVAAQERFGWKYGKVRDNIKHIHPCMVPWEELPEPEREKDRDIARNTTKLSKLVKMKVIKL